MYDPPPTPTHIRVFYSVTQNENRLGPKAFLTISFYSDKGPVKLIQRVKIGHSCFTVCVKSAPRYHFELAYV